MQRKKGKVHMIEKLAYVKRKRKKSQTKKYEEISLGVLLFLIYFVIIKEQGEENGQGKFLGAFERLP